MWSSLKPEVNQNDIKNTVPITQKTPFLSITNTIGLRAKVILGEVRLPSFLT
jgi:hypothetical protein